MSQIDSNQENIYSFKLINDEKKIYNFSPEVFSKIKEILLMLREDHSIIYHIFSYATSNQIENLSYFITQNFFENILSPKSLEDECLILLTKILKEKVNDIPKYNSKCNILLKSLFRNKDLKDFCNIVLTDIIGKIENENNFPIIFDLKEINTYIEEFNTQQKKDESNNRFTVEENRKKNTNNNDYKDKIGFKENMIFYSKYLSECYEEDIIELKEETENLEMLEYLDLILEKSKERNEKAVIDNIKFITNASNMQNTVNVLATYQRNFFVAINIISEIINKLNENVHLVPNFVKYICKIIEILLIKNDNNIKKIIIYQYIGKFFFSLLFSPILLSPDYECLIESFIISQQTLDNLSEINNIILKLVDFSIYNIKEKTNYVPFNWFFILDAMPKLINFFDNLKNIQLPNYINDLLEDKDNVYDFFKENEDQFFHLITIIFNVDELLILFNIIKEHKEEINTKLFINNEEKKNYFFKIFNSLERENIIHSLEELKKDEKYDKIYYLITKRIDTPLFEKLMKISQSNYKTFSRKKNEENHQNDQIIDLEQNLCCLLYNYKTLNEKNFSLSSQSDLKKLIEVITFNLKNQSNITEDETPCEIYGQNVLRILDELPDKYKENNYSELLLMIKNNVLSSIKLINFNLLCTFEEGIKYMEQTSKFYQYYKECLEISQPNYLIRRFVQTPYDELFIILNDNLEFETPKTFLKNENSTVLNFIKKFPNLNKIFMDCSTTLEQIESRGIDKKLKYYFEIIKKIIDNDENTKFNIGKGKKIIFSEIKDFILSKIYDKIFPSQQSLEDFDIFQKCVKLSWITLDCLSEKTYVIDNLITSSNKYFNMLNNMKSPKKKKEMLNKIFSIIKGTCAFNELDIEQDEINNLYIYTIIQSQPTSLYSNLKYLKLFLDPSEILEKSFLNMEICINPIKEFNFEFFMNKGKYNIDENKFNEFCKASANGRKISLDKIQ